ncbi:nucleoside diphosphate kinase regulator [Arenimonas terrae]|jgi:regulator of nucleoside diphosphate kinase|uniref:Nucleoside diphosphate kinase regulator n=1 Tax=Arenimonas terrae TaxID=2546226 RepID=A0A5C4RSH9_9GAMM|nr:nucleoside diphosphate kinase regulator [Arenimonas terrae]TNJ33547.1 nucleoside diphosphate kinase regulator [Arenimonas terrae]
MNVSLPPITVSSRDLARLEQLLDSPGLRHVPAALALGEELQRATVLPPERMPADVVTMNSTVLCVDEISGEHHQVTLSYPRDADVAAHRVSVLAPVGSALLGLSVGSVIDWQAPGGRALRVRVTGIRYQPEAAGDLNR